MSEELQFTLNDNGLFEEYDDKYDVTIHCETEEEQEEVLRKLSMGWIPVSERLPEDGELILFSTKTDCVYEGRYFDDNTHCQWYSFRDDTFAWNNVVTAWMPLPQPYKEESEDEE